MGTGLGFSSISSGTALPYIGSLVARGPSTKNYKRQVKCCDTKIC